MNASTIWNVNGYTRDQRAVRVTDTNGDLVALVTVDPADPEGLQVASKNAALITCAAAFQKQIDAILRWNDKQPFQNKIPRQLQRKLISTVMKSNAKV